MSREPQAYAILPVAEGIFLDDVQSKFNSGIEVGDPGFDLFDPLTNNHTVFSARQDAGDSSYNSFVKGNKAKNLNGQYVLCKFTTSGTNPDNYEIVIEHDLDRVVKNVNLLCSSVSTGASSTGILTIVNPLDSADVPIEAITTKTALLNWYHIAALTNGLEIRIACLLF